jgi:hypothetical protein
VLLQVADPISRKHVRRSIHLGGEPAGSQLRLIALAATELVVASWAELFINPTPLVEPEGAPPPEEARRAARSAIQRQEKAARELMAAPPASAPEPEPEPPAPERQRAPAETRLRLLGVIASRGFLAVAGQLWGGGLRVGADHGKVVSWTLDALHERGPLRREGRRYLLDTSTVGASVAFSYKRPLFVLRAGAALRAGVANSDQGGSEGANRTSAVVPWGWPSAILSGTLFPGRVAVELASEVGYAAVPIGSGTDAQGTPIRGAWIGCQLGLGFSQRSRSAEAGRR